MRGLRGVTILIVDEDDLVSPLSSQENFHRPETDSPVDNGEYIGSSKEQQLRMIDQVPRIFSRRYARFEMAVISVSRKAQTNACDSK
jgi:hypothetical protein